jgi:hypothetical protein
MKFGKEEETLDRCANNIVRFVKNVGFEWFDKWSDDEDTIISKETGKEVLRYWINL